MKKIVVLLLFLLVACSSQQPPVNPWPQPVPGPVTPPPPQTQPTPQPQTCQKAIKTRWLTFGYYSLFGASDSGTPDYETFAEDVCKSNFTGVSVHLLSPWDKLKGGMPKADDWPFTFKGGKFDTTKINPFWQTKFGRFLDAFGKRGLDVEVSFVDQYCCTSGLNKYLPQQYHPFRQNNIGIDWNSDAEALYSSIEFAPTRFNHISWTDKCLGCEHKLQWVFHVSTPAAKMIDAYMQTVVDSVVAALNKYPKMRVAWKWANETKGAPILKDTRGDRSEMVAYITEKFVAKGYPLTSKRLLRFIDRDYVPADVAKQRVLHDSIVRPYGVQDGLGAIHEIHGMCDAATIQTRIASGTAAAKDTLFSFDGNKCSQNFAANAKAAIKLNLPWMDVKMEEAWTPHPHYIQGQINKSWKLYAPVHLELAQ